MSRRFSKTQRTALLRASGGKCERCGIELRDNWHADHIQPWARGGATDVNNGQALCPQCNLRKGDSKMSEPNLREWQHRCLHRWAESDGDFLCVATPGAGKTRLALQAAASEMGAAWKKILVVTPTAHLTKQWAKKAFESGIELSTELTRTDLPSHVRRSWLVGDQYDGAAYTYQALASRVDDVALHVSRVPTLVILDEVHHAGDDKAWGDALRDGLKDAKRRLLLSGTPFRSDDNQIPFVRYEQSQTLVRHRNQTAEKTVFSSVADYNYSYRRALADGVCRPVHFPKINGQFAWWSGGEEYDARFDDDLPVKEHPRRLLTALKADGEWFSDVFAQAKAQLENMRIQDTRAAGLVIAADVDHARKLADQMAAHGEKPTVVVSEDDGASIALRDFAESAGKWIVAVKMVSEGVDIPRLRSMIYATNVTKPLFFKQAVGRVVRVRDDSPVNQDAQVFIPADARLIALADEISEDVGHYFWKKEEADGGAGPGAQREFFPVSAEDAVHEGTITVDGTIAFEEIRRAKDLFGDAGDGLSDVLLTKLYRRHLAAAGPNGHPGAASVVSRTPPALSLEERTARLRAVAHTMLKRLVWKTHKGDPPAHAWKRINKDLGKRFGFIGDPDTTNTDIERRIAEIQRRLDRLNESVAAGDVWIAP